jgi:hypothetical protein
MIGYVLLGQWNGQPSLAGRLLGSGDTFLAGLFRRTKTPAAPSYAANLAVRLFQVHFAIMVVASGLHKLQFGDWWSGIALWYPLHRPFTLSAERLRVLAEHRDATWLLHSLVQYPVLAWQLAFPVFAWRRRWRPVLLGGGVLAWVGSAFVYGEPLFGPFYLIGCLSYLTPAEWHGLSGRATRLVRLVTGALKTPARKQVGVRVATRS